MAAIFGPQTPSTSAHVQSICDAMEMPHVETRWDYRLKRDDYSVNVHPHPSSLSKVRHTASLFSQTTVNILSHVQCPLNYFLLILTVSYRSVLMYLSSSPLSPPAFHH